MSPALRLSLAANLALAIAVAALLSREHPSAETPVAVAARETREESATAPGDHRAPDAKLTPAAMAQLERLGLSREIVIDALHEDFNRRSARRMVGLQKRFAPKLVPERELVEFARRDEAEWTRELKASLGEDGFRAWDKERTLRELNRARVPGDELPMAPAEAEQAYRLQKEFDDKSRELQAMLEDGAADRADVGVLQAQAQQVLDRGLEQLLGKQRFDALRGNLEPTVDVYRRYGDLNPTPGQAQAVVQADQDYLARRAAVAQRFQASPADAASAAAELKALDDAHDQDLRRIFGPEAYDNLKRQSDPTFRALTRYAGAWELSDRDVRSVYDELHAFQDQAERTRNAAELSQASGQRVNWRDINAGLEQAKQQTEANLQVLLGAERLARLRENGLLDIR